MKEIIDRACDIECVTESDAKAVAALADLAVQLQSRLDSLEKDAEFLNWCADRFVHVYGESEHVDFVLKLRSMTAMQANKGE